MRSLLPAILAMAAVVLAPSPISNSGKCAAITEPTPAITASAVASNAIFSAAPGSGVSTSSGAARAALAGCVGRGRVQCRGRAISRLVAAQNRAVARHP